MSTSADSLGVPVMLSNNGIGDPVTVAPGETFVVSKNADGTSRYGLATAVSLLIFFAIALQCMSTIVTVRRETGSWKIPAMQFSFLFALAYALSFAGYRLALALL